MSLEENDSEYAIREQKHERALSYRRFRQRIMFSLALLLFALVVLLSSNFFHSFGPIPDALTPPILGALVIIVVILAIIAIGDTALVYLKPSNLIKYGCTFSGREYTDATQLTEAQIKSKDYENHFNRMANRLLGEVQELAKKGNISLLLGILTALSGLIILGFTVFDVPRTNDSAPFWSQFLPRISLVFFIEVFAYFFLGLYKQSLSEIKYFQNELTNLETKYLAIKLTLAEEHNESIKSIAGGLLTTERNFLLKKGESKVALKKQRMDSGGNA